MKRCGARFRARSGVGRHEASSIRKGVTAVHRVRTPEEIRQDLDHLFERRLRERGARYARRRYWQDVVSFLHSFPHDATLERAARERASIMSGFLFDLRHVTRAVRRQPGFFAVASLTLAIGCAAHLSAFTLLDRMLLSGPPHVLDADRVFRLHVDRAETVGTGRFTWFQTPYRSYLDLREQDGLFAAMAAYRTATASVGLGADAREISLVYADHHYWPLLRVPPQIGRVFGAEEDRPGAAAPVVVLGDSYWRAVHGGDRSVIGRMVRIGAINYTVIGVMPRGFVGDLTERVDAWVPLQLVAPELPQAWTISTTMRTVSVIVRLAPGVTRAAAMDHAGAAYRRSVDSGSRAGGYDAASWRRILDGGDRTVLRPGDAGAHGSCGCRVGRGGPDDAVCALTSRSHLSSGSRSAADRPASVPHVLHGYP